MKASLSQLLAPLLAVLLIAGGSWWWYANMEKRWDAQVETSKEAAKNPMLAATRLLARHRHPVATEETLSIALLKPLPRGTMILAGNSGVMTAPQVDLLLAWVARGNTLIASPLRSGEAVKEADENRGGGDGPAPATKPKSFPSSSKGLGLGDPLGEHFGVMQAAASRPGQICRRVGVATAPSARKPAEEASLIDCIASLTLPDTAYPLQLDAARARLASRRDTGDMLFSDDDAKAVRAFAHGNGRVIFVAENYFDNQDLPLYDHAELLLDLVDLDQDAGGVLIVQRPDVPAWYRALWAMVPLTLIALSVALLLWAWAAARRFGPLLPEPDLARRSLLEHVDASSRWLWKTGKGRAILLAAAREATEKILLRRMPELQKLAQEQKIELLTPQSGLAPSELDAALQKTSVPRAAEFTRQIQTLQRLRKRFERGQVE